MTFSSEKTEPSGEGLSVASFEGLLQRPLQEKPSGDVLVSTPVAFNGVAIGRIVAREENEVRVVVPVLGAAATLARVACALPQECEGLECAVLFVDGDPARPLVMGLLLNSPHQQENLPTRQGPDVRVDGERVVIEAERELELRCGESVILLQRDGRIEIRGNYVTSQATATQRIRGGSVHVN